MLQKLFRPDQLGGETIFAIGKLPPEADDTKNDADWGNHGTCVGSIVNTEFFGVAKKAKIRPVRLRPALRDPNTSSGDDDEDHEIRSFWTSSILSGLESILDSIRDNHEGGRAVINLSLYGGFSSSDITNHQETYEHYAALLFALEQEGAIVVCISGNDRKVC